MRKPALNPALDGLIRRKGADRPADPILTPAPAPAAGAGVATAGHAPAPAGTPLPEPKSISMTLRLTQAQYDRLRRYAYKLEGTRRRVTHQDILEAALTYFLDAAGAE